MRRRVDIEERDLSWGEFVPDGKRLRILGSDIRFQKGRRY